MNPLCNKCGLEIGFRRLPNGKWCPTNPDGSDHWDLCSATWIANMSKSERAAYDRSQAAARRPRRTLPDDLTHVYTNGDEVPPWDESLGEFRDFTDSEKLAGIVCEPVAP